MNQQALIESKTLRESVIDRTDVLEKVKKLTMLPDDLHVSVEMAAEYYEVGKEAINSCIKDNRGELESDGLRVLTGNELKSFKDMGLIGKNASAFTVIPRRAVLRIGMLLRDSTIAQTVRSYLLDAEQSHPVRESADTLHFRKEMMFLEAASNILRLPESGKLKLMGDFAKAHRLNVPLPAYAVNEDVTESATVLLKKHGAPFGAARFNTLLIQHGLLEERERPSSKGGVKMFKSLTETGLKYGKNIISPANPRETQPHYYASKFEELLKIIKNPGGGHNADS
ncbi:hypothetical protein WJ0W_003315 [Paenibacillus melissococcoides]|uniref:Antirepressor protein C-terminal domain-containing protein n=1 Tax=Paenibacillus melissococcoides TaxID=2912268 RepID=A0ABM9G399_9BACL|nr:MULTISPECIES: hypothetical protein [Paenibacillus]MEB9893249.1 hypothetical protein [Bacillus cereus]CAH8246078.1 hypothetical protein WJ0W_003315 [Paenibacillus melissococcoides]CAH8712910.1 hypothetical protein WDD9_003394 [Paenibacillus melissococcoides]CAH8713665.1 hypothetical protein HTL2_003697 [Paenibacillus melissococcoides]GIO78725.1 hypothetical protein J6TS7_23350 [Paenibacillus dendritiformis]